VRKASKRIVLTIGLALITSFLLFVSNEWNRAAFGVRDYIEKGEKFGISIGSGKNEVIDHLAAHGLVDGTTLGANETHYDPQNCHSHEYKDEYEVQIWDDHSWRQGVICVAFLDGKLARMSWIYGMFQP